VKILRAVFRNNVYGSTLHLDNGAGKPACLEDATRSPTAGCAWNRLEGLPTCTRCLKKLKRWYSKENYN